MADEDTILEEAMDNLKEVGQRIMATQSLMRSVGMTDGENYHDFLTRLGSLASWRAWGVGLGLCQARAPDVM